MWDTTKPLPLSVIRSPQDLAEVWNDLKGGKKVTLWSYGLIEGLRIGRQNKSVNLIQKSQTKKKLTAKREVAKKNLKDKKKKLDKIVTNLKEKHGSTYTGLIYSIKSGQN